MHKMIIASVVFAGWLSAPAAAEEQVFLQPVHDARQEYRVDVCRVWGYECGQPAADEFCRRQGFESAAEFKIAEDIGAMTPTMTPIAIGITIGWNAGVATVRPSTALSTEMAGVSRQSP